MSKIAINLEDTHTRSFDDSEFLYRDAKNSFFKILDRNFKNIENINRVHNTILINGKKNYKNILFINRKGNPIINFLKFKIKEVLYNLGLYKGLVR